MFRRIHSKARQKSDNDDDSNSNYDIVEVEVVETLSDDGDCANTPLRGASSFDEDEEYVEEEVFDPSLLPGIAEDDDEELLEVEVDEDEEEYDEEEIMNNSTKSLYSVRDVEVGDDNDDTLFEESVADEEYVDDTLREDDYDLVEVTMREEDGLPTEAAWDRSCQIRQISLDNNNSSVNVNKMVGTSLPTTKGYHETSPEDSSRDGDDDEDVNASAEELTLAIEYVLRQEKAVAKFILTDAQAEKMAHLPAKVMQVIVDHLELCDNDTGTPIDWDFLLKIVLPFCDKDSDEYDDNDDNNSSNVGILRGR